MGFCPYFLLSQALIEQEALRLYCPRKAWHFLRIYFKGSFRFTATLKERYKDFSYILCPNTCITFTVINIAHHIGAFVLIGEPTLTHHHHSKFLIYFRLHCWWCTFSGFGKCIMTCMHYCSIIQSSFTDLKPPVLCLFIPPPTSNCWQPLIFIVSL